MSSDTYDLQDDLWALLQPAMTELHSMASDAKTAEATTEFNRAAKCLNDVCQGATTPARMLELLDDAETFRREAEESESRARSDEEIQGLFTSRYTESVQEPMETARARIGGGN